MPSDLTLARAKRRVRRRVVKSLAEAAMRSTRPEPVALVYGAPDYEENSLVTALRLTERYPGRTVLVCRDPARTRGYLDIVAGTVGGDPAAVALQRLDKWQVLRLVGRAELLFYTHGLFFSPPSIGRRLHINLWHGTGPKSSANQNFPSVFAADALSSASPVWGLDTARTLGTRDPVVVLPGNARADLLVSAATTRAQLGWDDGRPVVLWLPTYRRSDDVSVGTLSEGRPVISDGAAVLGEAARRHGVRLIVKPHPFDAERLEGLGVEVVTTEQVWARGVSLSQAVAASAAVVSDYSSAWVDAMAAGVPIGLYCPDLAAYDVDRGFNQPPMSTLAAGLMLPEQADVDELMTAVTSGDTFRAADQRACAEALGLVSGPRSAAMLEAVAELGRQRRDTDFGLG